MRRTIEETKRRRVIQRAFNDEHHITPATVKSRIKDIMESVYEKDYVSTELQAAEETVSYKAEHFDDVAEVSREVRRLEKEMYAAAKNLAFEEAAKLRDRIKVLENLELQWR